MQEFHQAQLVAAPTPTEFYRIHAFLYEMQAQATGPHIVQVPAAELLGVDSNAPILEYYFKSRSIRPVLRRLYATKGYFDRSVRFSLIGVTNDVRQRFVDRQNDRPALCVGKSQHLREWP